MTGIECLLLLARRQRPCRIIHFFILLCVCLAGTITVHGRNEPAWVRRSPGVLAAGMAMDSAGNIVITGTTGQPRRIITMKYNPEGSQLWIRQSSGISNGDRNSKMAVSRNGEVYLAAGRSLPTGRYEILIIKYSSGGDEQWVRRYSSPDSSLDAASAVALDQAGNFYVAGFPNVGSPYILKYSAGGSLLWVREAVTRNCVMRTDAHGNLYVAGAGALSGQGGFVILKYTPAGVQEWARVYSSQADWVNSIRVDLAGNVHVGGGVRGDTTGIDAAVVKYSSSGVLLWDQRYAGPSNESDMAQQLALDSGGNVYGTGWSNRDYLTIKYSADGHQQWVRTYHGAANGFDAASDIAVTGSGRAFVTGIVSTGGSEYDLLTIGYSPEGVVRWDNAYNSPDSSDEASVGIETDGRGNIYILGTSNGNRPPPYNTTVIKYVEPLAITRPESGQQWRAGQQDTIRWIGRQLGRFIAVDYSIDSGRTYTNIVSDVFADSLVWQIPASVLTTRAKVRVRTTTVPLDTTESDTFRIKGFVMTRTGADGQYQPFNFALDRWSFGNIGGNGNTSMWPQSYWSQFNYQTGLDPYTNRTYPQDIYYPFRSAQSSDFPSWPIFVRAFGVEACYWFASSGHRFPRPSAMMKWWLIKDTWGGSCSGFSISSILAFDTPDAFRTAFPEIPAFPNLFSVVLSDSARKVIHSLANHWHGTQHQEFVSTVRNNTPNETIRDLKRTLGRDLADNSYLYIANNNIGGGAHAVVPYRVQRDTVNTARYIVDVYDNAFFNSPTARIIVDTTGNAGQGTWTYAFLPTWGGNSNMYLMDSSSAYLTSPILGPSSAGGLPAGRRGTQAVTLYPPLRASIRISNSAGQAIGFVDNVLIDSIPGAVSLTYPTARETAPHSYLLPASDYAVVLDDLADSVVSVGIVADSSVIHYSRDDASGNQVDRLWYRGGITARNGDPATKSINVRNVVMEQQEERMLSVSNYHVAHTDSFLVRVEGGNRLKVVNAGGQKAYDLDLVQTRVNTVARFARPGLSLAAHSTHNVVPDWTSFAQPVRIYVDHGNNGTIDDTLIVNNTVGVEHQGSLQVPVEYALAQNYPNPFNPSTNIQYHIPSTNRVTLKVFDVLGREVATLVDEIQEAGYKSVEFHAGGLASGVYLYRLTAGDFVATKKLVVLR